MGAIALEAITETYEDFRPLLDILAKKFKATYGGPYEDIRSDVDIFFIDAYIKHKPSRGRFEPYLSYTVWQRLFDRWVRTPAYNNARRRRVPLDSDTPAKRSRFEDLLERLSDDAELVAWLVISTPIDLKLALNDLGYVLTPTECKSPRAIKTAVRSVLSDLGWTANRITESFNEIAGAL